MEKSFNGSSCNPALKNLNFLKSLQMRKALEILATIPKSPDCIPILRFSFSHHLLKIIWQHIGNVSLKNVLVIFLNV